MISFKIEVQLFELEGNYLHMLKIGKKPEIFHFLGDNMKIQDDFSVRDLC